MATKKQKQELIEILKFTPTKVQILIQGYGGETYAGVVDRKIYDYFKSRKLDLEQYATDWDNEMKVPDEMQPFPAGSPYECDSLWHASGAELDSSNTMTIYEVDSGNELWEHNMDWNDLEDSGVTVECLSSSDLDDLNEGTIVFNGGQGEKGCFFDGELTLKAPFDPKKLKVFYEDCGGWNIVMSIEYDGEEIDGSGGYSTTGKWAENKWIIIGDEEVYESEEFDPEEVDEDRVFANPDYECVQCDWKGTVDEAVEGKNGELVCPECGEPIEMAEWDPAAELEKIHVPDQAAWPFDVEPAKTEWFDKDVKPAYKGEYEVVYDAEWPMSGMGMAEWTGRTWKQDGKKLAIKQWRGLTENINGE